MNPCCVNFSRSPLGIEGASKRKNRTQFNLMGCHKRSYPQRLLSTNFKSSMHVLSLTSQKRKSNPNQRCSGFVALFLEVPVSHASPNCVCSFTTDKFVCQQLLCSADCSIWLGQAWCNFDHCNRCRRIPWLCWTCWKSRRMHPLITRKRAISLVINLGNPLRESVWQFHLRCSTSK